MCDFLIFCISVSELQDVLKTLHVPACRNKPSIYSHAGGTDQIWKRKATDAHQLWTKRTDGVLSKLSGNRLISFMMLANLTGNSCLRKAKEVFSHAFSEPEEQKFEWKCDSILVFLFVENNLARRSYSVLQLCSQPEAAD